MGKMKLAIQGDTARAFERDAAQASISLDEIIRQMSAQGFNAAEISKGLTDAFEAGQGPFSQFKKLAKQSVAGLTSQRVSIETARKLSGGDGSTPGVWMSTGGSNVCPGCAKLHGDKMTADEFERRHGTNECGANCYCFWMPGETPEAGAFSIRSVIDEHPEWFRNQEGVQPPSLLATRAQRHVEDAMLEAQDKKPVDQRIETVSVVGLYGTIVARDKGGNSSVRIPEVDDPGSCIATHTHPTGGSFSPSDVLTMANPKYAFAEIGVCGDYVDGDGVKRRARYRCAFTSSVDRGALKNLDSEYDRAIEELVRSKPDMSDAEFVEVRHQAWVNVSKKLRLLYERTVD